jgi:hypothetical protein
MEEFLTTAVSNWEMLVAFGGAALAVYTIVRRFEKLLGKDREGRSIVDRLERLEHQLYPNGGSSIVDKVDYIRRDQNKMKEQISEISGEITVVRDILTIIVDNK